MGHWQRILSHLQTSKHAFLDTLSNPIQTQNELLVHILRKNAETEFGRHYNFKDIDSLEAYQSAVPIQTYDQHQPYIDKIITGERNILYTDDTIFMEKTGGSTAGPKSIPYTYTGLQNLHKAIYPWIADLLEYQPAIMDGVAYWLISPQFDPTTVIRNDLDFFGPAIRDELEQVIIQPHVAAPDLAQWKSNLANKLATFNNLSFISIWSPVFMLELLNALPKDLDPVDIWPNLTLLSCWSDGNSARFIPELQARLPHTTIQGKGLLATEAAISIPLHQYDYPVMANQSTVIEFMDMTGNLISLDQLTVGAEYEVIITTAPGLYRYLLGDRVQVMGYAQATPLLKFVGRNEQYSDLVGEKLSSQLVNQCLADLPGYALLCPASNGRQYQLFVDQQYFPNDKLNHLATTVDRRLCANPHYQLARELNQLEQLHCFAVKQPIAMLQQYAADSGRRIGDTKAECFSPSHEWEAIFLRGS